MPDWKIEHILAIAPVLSFAIDADEKLVFLSGGLAEQLGLASVQMQEQSAFRLANLPIKKHHFRRAMAGASFAITINLQGASYETQLRPYLENGTIIGVVGLAMDMTKHIQLEQYLDEEKHSLLAAQRLNSLAGVASGLAHEINNPLAIISGYSQQLLSQAEKGTLSNERLIFTVRKLIDTCTRCHRIIESIKSFARDGSRDSFQACSINEWVDSAFILCRERFQSMGVQLDWIPLELDITVDGRLLQLVQALFNILTNAFEAAVQTPNPSISITCNEQNGFVYLRVYDNGPGIAESYRVSIFQPFFTTKDQTRSVGIGLSTAKGMIEGHQGNISFTSQPGSTCFTIQLPKRQVLQAPVPPVQIKAS